MKQKRHLLYLSSILPKQSFGGSIILYRHLSQIETKGWKISVASSAEKISEECFSESWQTISLSDRRWWWPPVRAKVPGSLDLRLHLWEQECYQLLREEPPTAILTVLWDFYSLLAALLSKKWQIPLSVVVHDDWELWGEPNSRHLISRYKGIVLNQATRVWPVSKRLCESLPLKNPDQASVLLPIPHGKSNHFVEWFDQFKDTPVITYAGNFYSSFSPTLEMIARSLKKINGKLLLITNPNNPDISTMLANHSNIEFCEPFQRNADVIEFLSKTSSCILVGYPLEVAADFKWRNSFPSKLLEFSQLGLPIMILASPDTALSDWATERNWLCYMNTLDEAKLSTLLEQLTDQKTWIEMAEQSRLSASTEFSSTFIQSQFELELAMAS